MNFCIEKKGGSKCIKLECDKSKKGSFACFYVFDEAFIKFIEDEYKNDNILIRDYSAVFSINETGQIIEDADEIREFSDEDISKLLNILKTDAVKLFHKKNSKRMYGYETANISDLYNIYGDELSKWTTTQAIDLENRKSYAFSFLPKNERLSFKIDKVDISEIFFILQEKCQSDISGILNNLNGSNKNLINYDILKQNIIDSLAILHKKGFIHRDIKEENIVYCPDSEIKYKLIDFGFLHKAGDVNNTHFKSGTSGFFHPKLVNYLINYYENEETRITNFYNNEQTQYEKNYKSNPAMLKKAIETLEKNYNDRLEVIKDRIRKYRGLLYSGETIESFYKYITKLENQEFNVDTISILKNVFQNILKDIDTAKGIAKVIIYIDTLLSTLEKPETLNYIENYQTLQETEKLDYLNDLYAVNISLLTIKIILELYENKVTIENFNMVTVLPNQSDDKQESQGGTKNIKKSTKKIHILGRERVIYLGKNRRQYILIKGIYTPLSEIKRQTQKKTQKKTQKETK